MRSGWPMAATPGSVTSITRFTPRRLSSQPASAAAPGPNLMGVASSVKIVSWSRAAVIALLLSVVSPWLDGSMLTRDRNLSTALQTPSASATCSSTTTSARPSRSTGPAATAASRAPVVRPADAEQVAAVLGRLPRARRAAIVPQGGNTGHGRRRRPARRRGGPQHARGSPSSARSIARSAQVTAGAGVTLARAAGAAHAPRAWTPASTSPRATARTVGGLAATNAGGIRAHALRDRPRARRGAAGGAGRRLDHRAPDPAQGQRRLRPVGAARRQRGHARRSSPPSAGGWCRGSPAAWRR